MIAELGSGSKGVQVKMTSTAHYVQYAQARGDADAALAVLAGLMTQTPGSEAAALAEALVKCDGAPVHWRGPIRPGSAPAISACILHFDELLLKQLKQTDLI